ncbi:unnamed protein product [Victoria cruziana]
MQTWIKYLKVGQGPAAFLLGLDHVAHRDSSPHYKNSLRGRRPNHQRLGEGRGGYSSCDRQVFFFFVSFFHFAACVPLFFVSSFFHWHSPGTFRVESILGDWRSSNFQDFHRFREESSLPKVLAAA